jgi:methionine synthase II (cobalamin-independent)
MQSPRHPGCLPVLIGSLPLEDHREATGLVLSYTPQIPLWVQLPCYAQEGMMRQFLPGLPGLTVRDDRWFIDSGRDDFDQQLIDFFEDYMAVSDGAVDILGVGRFALTEETARGFFVFLDEIAKLSSAPFAVKGQITGPITLGTGIRDQDGRAIFYDTNIRDAMVKHLAMQAKWQTRRLAQLGSPVIIFIDEPALAGFGSSELISITVEEIQAGLAEVIAAIQSEGGLAGVHVCANTDWSLLLKSQVDIVNFDAFGYFDRFILYQDALKTFLARGGIIAWGVVPTLNADDIRGVDQETLMAQWQARLERVTALGVDRQTVLRQSLITPACGTGSLSRPLAEKVLALTRQVSETVRQEVLGK